MNRSAPRHTTRYAASAAAAALLAVGTGLSGSASASAATISEPASGGTRFLLLIDNTPEEWVLGAIDEGPSVMDVERSASRSQAVDNLFGCHEVADSVTIAVLDIFGGEITSYTMHTACIVSFVYHSDGTEDATFIFNSLTTP